MTPSEDCFHIGVKGLLHNDEGKLLLLQLNPKKLKSKAVCWDIPGGRIQQNESQEEALRREVYEETGLQNLTHLTHVSMVLSSLRLPMDGGDVGLVFSTFLCRLQGSCDISLSNDHIRFAWFDPADVADLLGSIYPRELKEQIRGLKLGV